MYTITDHSSNETYTVEDRFELEDKLNELFDRGAFAYEDEETAEEHTIGEVIDDLVSKIGHEYTGDEEATLNISID